MSQLERFSISMEASLLEAFDGLITRKGYTNRSEAVRDLVRDYLVQHEWQEEEQEVVGAVALVYDHHVRELTHALVGLQHQAEAEVVCSTHVHLDEHHCLEVIVLRGRPGNVRQVADQLIGTRGVKHGRLMTTTTGKDLQ